jgi:shikimate kinase
MLFTRAVRSHIAGMTAAAKSIVLIGMMGAGKSSIGRCLETLTGLSRFDTDESIVSKCALSIPEIFSKYGEARFRDMETEILSSFMPAHAAIVVTGGGMVLREQNVVMLKRLGTVVYLEADEGILFERATRRGNRPLLQGENPRARFSQIFHDRAALYAAAADFRINTTSSTHEEVARAILDEIENRLAAARL